MHLHLYRPFLWWDGAVVRYVQSSAQLRVDDAWPCIRLRRATYFPPLTPSFGALMSDDRSFALQLVTPPATEPVTLDQAKTFLRIDYTMDDDAITTAITAARQYAEQYLRFALLPQVWNYTRANPGTRDLALPIGPAQSITSVTLTNELGASTVMDTTDYRLSADGYTVLFHTVPRTEKLAVLFSASSYASSGDIPAPIIQGMLYHIAVMMETRDGSVALPMQSVNCYQAFRRVVL